MLVELGQPKNNAAGNLEDRAWVDRSVDRGEQVLAVKPSHLTTEHLQGNLPLIEILGCKGTPKSLVQALVLLSVKADPRLPVLVLTTSWACLVR